MVLYKCSVCLKEYTRKSNYESHKNRKKPCLKLTVNDCNKNEKNCQIKLSSTKSNVCKYCNKTFTKNHNLLAHMRDSCKIKKQCDAEKENIYNKLLVEMEELKRMNREIEEKNNKIIKENKKLYRRIICLEKNNKNISVTTNINNGLMYNNNIKLVAYGKEDYKHIDQHEVLDALNGFGTEVALTKLIHFNEKYPEYHNIYINNKKDKYAMVFDGDKWILECKTTVIEGIYDKNREYVEEKMDDFVRSLDQSRINALKRWLDTEETSDKIKKIKDDLRRLLYNEKELITKTSQFDLIEKQ